MNSCICSNHKMIRWDITKNCNLNCKHCITSGMYDLVDELTYEEKLRVIDNMYKNGVKKVHLLGGEATIIPRIGELIEYMTSKEIEVSLNTNSVVLSNDKKMCELFADNSVGISFSIDGVDNKTHDTIRGNGSFNKVLTAAINYLYFTKDRKDIVRAFYFTLTPDNKKNDFCLLFEIAKSHGINNIVIGVLIPEGNGKKNYEQNNLSISEIVNIASKIITISQDYPEIILSFPFQTPLLLKYFNEKLNANFGLCYTKCKAGFKDFSLQPDGTLYPCIFSNASSNYTSKNSFEEKSNNLLFNDLSDIVSNEFYIDFMKLLTDVDAYNTVEPCDKCPYNNILDICRPCSLQHNDKIDSKDFHRNEICKYILTMNNNNFYW